ncbi:MAG TPA: redoxin domain-containing protein [Sunxiuqinia sp.]|nr:redoxin domain-containing protein [Sunxiuqinia sp.]
MTIKHLLLFLLVVLLLPFTSNGNEVVTLKGNAPDYSGYHISFYRLADAISGNKEVVGTINIDSDGNFNSHFNISEITYCFAEFDAYHASIYLTPGANYQLAFPPVKKVPEAQKRSQFFKPDEISFELKGNSNSDINQLIKSFEVAYMKEESRYFNQIYRLHSEAAVDSLQLHLRKQFPKTNNSYFENYKFYRLASAEFALNQGHSENFVKTYFIDHKPNLKIPTCTKLFHQLFTNYFTFEGNSLHGKAFKILVGRAELDGLQNYFTKTKGWNANLSRLVILQSINDAYYQGEFPKSSLLRLLDKITASNWPSLEKTIASRVKEKLTYLQVGSQAPDITMTDFSGNKHRLSDFEDKYIYLTFTRVSNPICRQHLDQLKKMGPSVLNQLHVINLIMPEEADKKQRVIQQNWPGKFYIVSDKAADKYRVMNFPLAYLIDKNGKLVYSPAPNPLDGFERRFIGLLKQKRLDRLRNQSK